MGSRSILRRLRGAACIFSLALGACDALPDTGDAPARDAALDGPSLDAPTSADVPLGSRDGAIDSGAPGAIIDAASCARADVEAAIARATSGDTVQIPGGSATWDATVTIPSTLGITLDGGGCQLDGRIRIEQHPTASSRVTNFAFVGRIIDP